MSCSKVVFVASVTFVVSWLRLLALWLGFEVKTVSQWHGQATVCRNVNVKPRKWVRFIPSTKSNCTPMLPSSYHPQRLNRRLGTEKTAARHRHDLRSRPNSQGGSRKWNPPCLFPGSLEESLNPKLQTTDEIGGNPDPEP